MVEEPEPEVEEDDPVVDDWEAVEEVLLDLRLAELTVPLVLEDPVTTEAVGTMTGVVT